MAHGTISNDGYVSSGVKKFLSTKYPIRSESQILSSKDVSSAQEVIYAEINRVKNELEGLVTACDSAKAYCGIESLSLTDGNGNEANEFPNKLSELSKTATVLIEKLNTLNSDLNTFISSIPNNDRYEYNNWLNSPDNPANQVEGEAV